MPRGIYGDHQSPHLENGHESANMRPSPKQPQSRGEKKSEPQPHTILESGDSLLLVYTKGSFFVQIACYRSSKKRRFREGTSACTYARALASLEKDQLRLIILPPRLQP